ncbi:MAG TPA: bifunctional fructose-bisphosphatase/inositol-phosphate phosphatase [Methanocorpusculum sp.]|nr:bifunctional fructose-bisphosphatase/inositol-phosphate phosphatase [Methanocorpusculum sp.]HJK01638.1 bifunctional fructose-bisphosphatase/inositol-phosphate phosphatase [Methanocorpusculum sp.]
MITPFQFLSVCDEVGKIMMQELAPIIGSAYAGEELCIGADNTPTERIDHMAEEMVLSVFREKQLCRLLLSEEIGMVEIGGDTGIAYLDPMDGTFNAVSGIPFYALSIALSDGYRVMAGYVKNLANGETFTAIQGKGACLNGKPIQVSTETMLDHSAMSVYAKKFDMTRMVQLGHKIRRWRLLGASALELCYVACGRLDGFVDMRNTLRVTDAAAGILICQEAGGEVTLPDGGALEFPDNVESGRCVVATNRVIHRKVIEYLRS